MDQSIGVLQELNEIFVSTHGMQNKDAVYKQKCEIQFTDIRLDDETINSLIHRIKYNEIEYIPDQNKLIPVTEILSSLKSGNLRITPYGRSLLNLYATRSNISILDSKIKEVDGIKNNIYTNLLTLMGIIIAVIVFIIQGMNLIKNDVFANLDFPKQLQTVISLYLPLAVTLILIFLSYFIFQLIKRIFK